MERMINRTESKSRIDFKTRLEYAFERAKRREDFRYAVVVFALDFDTLPDDEAAAAVHDGLMREVGQRLMVNFRPTDTLARVGGSKFVALYEDLRQPADVGVITDRLAVALLQPYYLPEATYCPKLHMGAALNARPARAAQDILEAAERSLKPLGLSATDSG